MQWLTAAFNRVNRPLVWRFALALLIVTVALLLFPTTVGVHSHPGGTPAVSEQVAYEFRVLYTFLGALFVLLFSLIAIALKIRAKQDPTPMNRLMALGNTPVSQAMKTEFSTLGPQDSLDRAVTLTLAGFEP